MAADQHYLSDVLIGAVVGGFVGWAIPRFLHSPEPGTAQAGALRVAPGGLVIAF
jgi:membrane-associated phospholipid phosphatase